MIYGGDEPLKPPSQETLRHRTSIHAGEANSDIGHVLTNARNLENFKELLSPEDLEVLRESRAILDRVEKALAS